MKRTLEILLVGLIAGGLLTGCPKKDGEEKAETDEPATATQEEPEEPKTAAQEEPEPETAAQVEVNEENYQKALFEVSCVKAKIDDTEEQKAIITEVYARYGFDEETFGEAQTAMKDKADVQAALTSKMEDCTPELAASFAKAGEDAEGDEAEEGDEKDEKEEKKPSKKWKEGSYIDSNVTGGGLSKGQLKIRVTGAGKVLGSFQGTREGRGFSIPLKGEIQKNGEFQARGNRGPNNARAVGRYGNGTLKGKIRGSVNKKGLTVAFNAK